MKKSKYLVLNSFYFDFNDDLTEIINTKESFKKQNILDLHRFDILKNIERFAFKENQIKHLKLPQNIEIIDNYSFNKNQIEILDLSNCINLKVINENAFKKNPLNEIKILDNINIEYYKYLKNDLWNKFVKYYNDNKMKSGDYKLENNEWKWYPL